jgi:hypothetical protein
MGLELLACLLPRGLYYFSEERHELLVAGGVKTMSHDSKHRSCLERNWEVFLSENIQLRHSMS